MIVLGLEIAAGIYAGIYRGTSSEIIPKTMDITLRKLYQHDGLTASGNQVSFKPSNFWTNTWNKMMIQVRWRKKQRNNMVTSIDELVCSSNAVESVVARTFPANWRNISLKLTVRATKTYLFTHSWAQKPTKCAGTTCCMEKRKDFADYLFFSPQTGSNSLF